MTRCTQPTLPSLSQGLIFYNIHYFHNIERLDTIITDDYQQPRNHSYPTKMRLAAREPPNEAQRATVRCTLKQPINSTLVSHFRSPDEQTLASERLYKQIELH